MIVKINFLWGFLLGIAEFQKFYGDMWGERWSALWQSLAAPEKQVARRNLFLEGSGPLWLTAFEFKEIPRGSDGLLQYYIMDQASIYAGQAMEVQPGDKVLDMCAAPGGKTLILAEALRGDGELSANEMSEARRDRLKKVIQQYIPRSVRDRVWVTGKDGGKFALSHKDQFDRILVDAPCSGEQHLLENKTEMSEWKPSRSEKLAQRQYALLTAALLAVKPGGRIVYSTCSISNLENDEVIARLLKKKEGQFLVVETTAPHELAEKTKYGWQFLPDRSHMGPIYFSVLKRSQ